MNQKTIWIAGGVLIVAAFLLGFIPQYVKVRDLDSQLGTTRRQLQMREVDLLIGRVFLDTSQKNYGLASQSATRFFDQARSVAGEEIDPKRKAFLQDALTRRDAVIGGLAKGDPGTLAPIQDLFQRALSIN